MSHTISTLSRNFFNAFLIRMELKRIPLNNILVTRCMLSATCMTKNRKDSTLLIIFQGSWWPFPPMFHSTQEKVLMLRSHVRERFIILFFFPYFHIFHHSVHLPERVWWHGIDFGSIYLDSGDKQIRRGSMMIK